MLEILFPIFTSPYAINLEFICLIIKEETIKS